MPKRGGSREGAGRPRKLSFEERAWVYDRYDQLENEAVKTKTSGRVADAYGGTDQEELFELIHRVPANLRRKSDGKTARQLVSELAAMDELPDDWPDYPDVIIEAAEALKHHREAATKRPRYFEAKRLYGDKSSILEHVAREASDLFGKDVSRSLVQRIIDDRQHEFASDDRPIDPDV